MPCEAPRTIRMWRYIKQNVILLLYYLLRRDSAVFECPQLIDMPCVVSRCVTTRLSLSVTNKYPTGDHVM